MWISIAVFLVFAGCRCNDTPKIEEVRNVHGAGFDTLVTLAAMGEVPRGRAAAGDVVLVDTQTAEHVEALAGAVGFVRVAESPADLADGVAAMAAACGGCHGAVPLGVQRPVWTHTRAADWAVFGVVWGEAEAPPEGGDVPPAVRAAWVDPVPKDSAATDEAEVRLTRVFTACQSCHSK